MLKMWITLNAIYRVYPDIFDGFSLPKQANKDRVIDSILLECGSQEVAYPDADLLRDAIRAWSAVECAYWAKMGETLELEYNPIWNKDGTVTETFTSSGTSEGLSKNAHEVAAYNDSDMTLADRDENTGKTDSTSKGENVRVEQGNIGVTTTQHLMTEEMELREKYNLEKIIVNAFKSKFIIGVY